jgi:hypothetical protein
VTRSRSGIAVAAGSATATAAVVAIAFGIATLGGQSANAALVEPKVPEQVVAYFATGLIPRLTDLYGSKTTATITFDATTKVGGIRRLLSFTDDFLQGKTVEQPTELTNTWIAPITENGTTVLGLATVWINPGNDLPDLADFDPGPDLVAALATAPPGTLIIRDDPRSAFLATDGSTLTVLVSGTSGVVTPITPAAYQKLIGRAASRSVDDSGRNSGLLVAGSVLGVVVVLMLVVVLRPVRRRKREPAIDADAQEPPAV